MSRYDGRLEAESEARAEDIRLVLVSLDSAPRPLSPRERQDAIVCLLSASDGWRDASGRLGGAFADDPSVETRLKGSKGE